MKLQKVLQVFASLQGEAVAQVLFGAVVFVSTIL